MIWGLWAGHRGGPGCCLRGADAAERHSGATMRRYDGLERQRPAVQWHVGQPAMPWSRPDGCGEDRRTRRRGARRVDVVPDAETPVGLDTGTRCHFKIREVGVQQR